MSVTGQEVLNRYNRINDTLIERVIAAIRKHGPCSTTEVYGLLGRHPTGGKIPQALAALVDSGQIIGERTPTGARGGRPGIRWQMAK